MKFEIFIFLSKITLFIGINISPPPTPQEILPPKPIIVAPIIV